MSSNLELALGNKNGVVVRITDFSLILYISSNLAFSLYCSDSFQKKILRLTSMSF